MFDDNKNAQRSEDDLFKVSDSPGRNSQTADLLHKPQQRGGRAGGHTAVHAVNQCVHPAACSSSSSSKIIKIPLRQKAPLAFLCFNNSINCKSDATVTLKLGRESGAAGFSNYKPCHHIQSAVSGYRTLARKSV